MYLFASPRNLRIILQCSLFIYLLLRLSNAYSQDTIYFKNGNFIDGEIKSMEHNLLKIDTEYGDKEFIIKWKEVHEIFTGNYFFIYISDGTIRYGWLRSRSDVNGK